MAKVYLNAHDFEEIRKSEKPEQSINMFLDQMIRRFKKQVENEGILEECRRREYFLKKSLKRKEKSKRAKIREIKRRKKASKRY